MRKGHIDGIRIKAGPTESGGQPTHPEPVGGELIPAELFPVLSQYWLLILVILLPLTLILYKKRHTLFPIILKMLIR